MSKFSNTNLISERDRLYDLLTQTLSRIADLGQQLALAESEYRIAKATRVLELRGESTPITLIPDVVKGSREVALTKARFDGAEVNYKTEIEALNVYKLQLRTVESQISRDWSISE